MCAEVVLVTGAKNKMRLEKNSNRRAFRDQKVRHPELQKRLCDYVKVKDNKDAQLVVKCAN